MLLVFRVYWQLHARLVWKKMAGKPQGESKAELFKHKFMEIVRQAFCDIGMGGGGRRVMGLVGNSTSRGSPLSFCFPSWCN